MKIVYFTHSLASCWNHGNAHFVRGVLRNLIQRGHDVDALEPQGAWSLQNLLTDHGQEGLRAWREAYSDLHSKQYGPDFDPSEACTDADLVIVHEWNDAELVSALGRLRAKGGRFTLLFHDTHHRAVSAPQEMQGYDLDGYDGILAFGAALAEVYRRWGWGDRAFVWHEAADISLFKPPADDTRRNGLVWIGNWGDGERTAELETYLLAPAKASGLALEIYGVRYPAEALALLARYGAVYRNWLANARAPAVFAQRLATVHVPRRFYVRDLPGIPTIRVFEALACGIPLVSAPWDDAENLFRPGRDYLVASDGPMAERHLRALAADPELRAELALSGLETVRARHTCAHRVDELLSIVRQLAPKPEVV
ncbi:glycosyltransferase [Acidisphaera sp. L21]|uniref:CgeB family protein n=1 Tax=Acidisphaera sp. L21 TaxID=1641851 RepID=UPI00131BAF48|nr:glycosyltransferase [Acidisphaera sp. L21]